jgi:hypothetical protein
MLTSSSTILANSTFAALSQTFKNRFAPASSVSSLHDGSRTTTAKEGISTAADYSKASSAAIDQSKATGGTTTTTSSSSSTVVQQLIEIKSELKITKCVRTTTLWAPASLLCKRFNVKVPTQPSSSHLTQALITGAKGVLNLDEQVKTIIDARVDQSIKNSSYLDHKSDKQRTIERDDNDDDSADVYLRPAASRVNNSNPLSEFKSIFEDSDSSDSDSDSDEDGDDQEDGGDGKEEGNENEESATRNDSARAKIDSARATIVVGDAAAVATLSKNKDVVKIDACSDAAATTTGQELKAVTVAVKYVKSSDRQTIAILRDGIGGRRNPLKSISSMHPPLSQLKKREGGEGGGIDSIRALDTANTNNPTSNRSVTDLKSETAEKRRFQLSFSSEEIDDDCGGIKADIDIININNKKKKVKHDAPINHHRRSDKDGALQDQLSAHSMEQKDCNGHRSSSESNRDVDTSADGDQPFQSSITTNQPHHNRPTSDKGAVPHYILDRFTQQHPFSSAAADDDDDDNNNNNNNNNYRIDDDRIAKESSHVVSINGVSVRASISKLETYLHNKDDSDDDDDESGGKRRRQSKKNKHSKKSKRTKDNKHKEKKERHKSEKKKKKSKKKKTRKVSCDSSSGSSSSGGDSDDDDD